MYETLKRLYNDKKINDVSLGNAVSKGWITNEEKATIIALAIV